MITLAAASGASYLYRSASGGKTWQTTTYVDGGLSFGTWPTPPEPPVT